MDDGDAGKGADGDDHDATDDLHLQGGHSNSINTRRLPPPVAGPGPGYADSPPPPHRADRQLGPGHFSPPPPELPKHLSRGPSREHIPEQMKNKIEVRHIYHFYNISRNRLSESEYPFNSHGDIEEDPTYYVLILAVTIFTMPLLKS